MRLMETCRRSSDGLRMEMIQFFCCIIFNFHPRVSRRKSRMSLRTSRDIADSHTTSIVSAPER